MRWLGPWEGQQAGAVLLLCFQVLVVMGGLVLGTAYLWRSLRDRAARPAYPPEAYEQQQGQGGGGGGLGGRAWVVETLPVGGMEGLGPVPGSLATGEALLGLVEGAQACIQLSAMYWALNASSSSSLSPEQLAALGSERGERLLAALHAAAARGVAIHVLMDNATIAGDPGELQALQAAYPEQVKVRTWGAGQWFGGCGVMHLKLWVVDGRHAYLGSANLDWLSLSQVKEVGLLLRDCGGLVGDLQALWHDWWAWAKLPPPPTTTAAAAGGSSSSPSWVCGVWSPELQVELTRPCWSPLLPPAPGCPRCASPLPPPVRPASSLSHPLTTTLNGEEARLAVTGSPVEVLSGGRSWDLDGLLSIIRGARHSLDVAVMDWLPASLYPLPQPQQPGQEAVSVWWPVLQDAVLAGLLAKPGLRVRLLVSRWAHSDPRMLSALKAWLQQAQALFAPAGSNSSSSSSQRLSIKVGGWLDGPCMRGSSSLFLMTRVLPVWGGSWVMAGVRGAWLGRRRRPAAAVPGLLPGQPRQAGAER